MLALLLALSLSPSTAADELVAVRAGTIHLVKDGAVLEGGATLLIKGGRVLAVGTDLEIPASARIVDYGMEAVIVPGFVAASSPHALSRFASERAADPGLLAVEGFDFYAAHGYDLAAGVTSVYITPAQGRLIAGQGAVVKLGKGERERRIVRAPAALHGSVAQEARNTPGYWKPPIPATVDVGLGLEEPQPPRSTMGGVHALRQLHAAARNGTELEGFGPNAVRDLAPLLEAQTPWRIRAGSQAEVRALLDFAADAELALIVELVGGPELDAETCAAMAAAGVGAIVELPFIPNRNGRDLGASPDAAWPVYDLAARLVAAGVRVAISTADTPRHLRFAAAVGARGGLDPAAALRAITLTPAELLGVSARVGALSPGMDADFAVLGGAPLSGAGVLATWVDGAAVWTWASSGARAASADGLRSAAVQPVVLAVDELYVGDGEVLAPGEILMQGGRITEVGRNVGRPRGALVVRGRAAMPGMIDSLGHLGLEGTREVPPTDFELARIVAPGDPLDRRVGSAGVTTVVLSPRRASKSGAPLLAYKPAAASLERQVIQDPAALRLAWADKDRAQSGADVRALLEKAVEYTKSWKEYETAMASWTPPAPGAADEKDAAKEDGEEKDGDKDDEKGDKDAKATDKKADEKKNGDAGDKDDEKDAKKKKKKKGDAEEVDPDPVTGIWRASVIRPPMTAEVPLRMQIKLSDGRVEGSLRCSAVTDGLVSVEGTYTRTEEGSQDLALHGLGTQGFFTLSGPITGDELAGKLVMGSAEVTLTAKRETRDYPVAERQEQRVVKPAEEKPPKGKPKEPRRDPKLEPLRRAIEDGSVAVIVEVEREDEILACVTAFAAAGIRPVLFGAGQAHRVADQIRGKIAGVLPSSQIVEGEPKKGTDVEHRYAALQSAGIPVAFHSEAEEGAADLPLIAAYAVSEGMSRSGALRALTADAAAMLSIGDRVGRIATGCDADVLLLDGSPLDPATQVVRTWVNGVEIP